jgi:hypothetical protein
MWPVLIFNLPPPVHLQVLWKEQHGSAFSFERPSCEGPLFDSPTVFLCQRDAVLVLVPTPPSPNLINPTLVLFTYNGKLKENVARI